jgi:hypothetical protein
MKARWAPICAVQSVDAGLILSSIEILWYLGKNCTIIRTVHILDVINVSFHAVLKGLREVDIYM